MRIKTSLCLFVVLVVQAFACTTRQPEPTPPAQKGKPEAVKKLSSIGVLDPNWNPVVSGGLPDFRENALTSTTWKEGTTTREFGDVYMVFRSSEMPGGYALWRTTVPAGTQFVFDPESGHGIAMHCGNPTCWRWLVDRATPMKNEGIYDPSKAAIITGGLSATDKSRLEQMGWERAITEDLMRDVEIAAAATTFPGIKVQLRKFDVPKGTEYYFNRQDGRAIIVSGGNATAAEWLVSQRTDG